MYRKIEQKINKKSERGIQIVQQRYRDTESDREINNDKQIYIYID